MRSIFALLLLFTAAQVHAAEWVYEFELTYAPPTEVDRLLMPDCDVVVPPQYVKLYAQDPRPGWTIACGNRQPMYTHFLGRSIGHPLPRLEFEIGWRHLSSPMDHHEITFDALSVRGRFTFGRGGR